MFDKQSVKDFRKVNTDQQEIFQQPIANAQCIELINSAKCIDQISVLKELSNCKLLPIFTNIKGRQSNQFFGLLPQRELSLISTSLTNICMLVLLGFALGLAFACVENASCLCSHYVLFSLIVISHFIISVCSNCMIRELI